MVVMEKVKLAQGALESGYLYLSSKGVNFKTAMALNSPGLSFGSRFMTLEPLILISTHTTSKSVCSWCFMDVSYS